MIRKVPMTFIYKYVLRCCKCNYIYEDGDFGDIYVATSYVVRAMVEMARDNIKCPRCGTTVNIRGLTRKRTTIKFEINTEEI